MLQIRTEVIADVNYVEIKLSKVVQVDWNLVYFV